MAKKKTSRKKTQKKQVKPEDVCPRGVIDKTPCIVSKGDSGIHERDGTCKGCGHLPQTIYERMAEAGLIEKQQPEPEPEQTQPEPEPQTERTGDEPTAEDYPDPADTGMQPRHTGTRSVGVDGPGS